MWGVDAFSVAWPLDRPPASCWSSGLVDSRARTKNKEGASVCFRILVFGCCWLLLASFGLSHFRCLSLLLFPFVCVVVIVVGVQHV